MEATVETTQEHFIALEFYSVEKKDGVQRFQFVVVRMMRTETPIIVKKAKVFYSETPRPHFEVYGEDHRGKDIEVYDPFMVLHMR